MLKSEHFIKRLQHFLRQTISTAMNNADSIQNMKTLAHP